MKTANLVALVSVYCFLSLFLVVLSLFVFSVNSVLVYSGSVGLGECLKRQADGVGLKKAFAGRQLTGIRVDRPNEQY